VLVHLPWFWVAAVDFPARPLGALVGTSKILATMLEMSSMSMRRRTIQSKSLVPTVSQNPFALGPASSYRYQPARHIYRTNSRSIHVI
jgi:hypothetical protein